MITVFSMDGHRLAFYQTAGDVPGLRSATLRNVVGRMRLPSEPDKSINLTFTGVKAGSEIYIFDANRAQLAGAESAGDPQTFQIPHYPGSNPLNTIRILIASLAYEDIDLSFTVTNSDASIPIQQRIDRNYKNPT